MTVLFINYHAVYQTNPCAKMYSFDRRRLALRFCIKQSHKVKVLQLKDDAFD